MSLALTRLVAAGTRGARLRLVGIAAGVGIGVTLFLLLWGAFNGLQDREERSSWTALAVAGDPVAVGSTPAPTRDTVLVSSPTERFDGTVITRLDIAATSDSTVTVPGISRPPAAGTYYASPALAELIDSVPANQLGERFGTRIGLISDTALASPDSLVVVTGQPAARMTGAVMTFAISDFPTLSFGGRATYQTLAVVGGIAILLPVLLLVGIVTDLGAAERRERFATLRLLGATPGVVARIAMGETALTSLTGALLGVLLAWLVRPLAALLPINEGTFFVADLAVPPVAVIAAVTLTVLATSLTAGYRTYRAGVGPLGVTRQQRERRPRVVALVPLTVGFLGMLGVTVCTLADIQVPLFSTLLIGGFILTAVGLVLAGPYLTYRVSRVAARRARGAAGVIALARITATPRATFRAVSGLLIALFVVTVFTAAVTSVDASVDASVGPGSPGGGEENALPAGTLLAGLDSTAATDFDESRALLTATEGVRGVALAYSLTNWEGVILSGSDAATLGLLPSGAAGYVSIDNSYINVRSAGEAPPRVTEAPTVNPDDLEPWVMLILTDGTVAAQERARTTAETGQITLMGAPASVAENQGGSVATLMRGFTTMAHLGVLIATLISTVSLAVSTTASILDRRRSLGLLRLMGMPVPTLRRIILGEAALPFLTVVGGSILLGVGVAWSLITTLTYGKRVLSWPEPSAYIVLGVSLLLALTAVLATFRTARAHTAVSVTRFE
ncbi:ABC transporter permease [Klugiella xanthotipulae]|uniref:FtsX-like permease family protein n=1 Tax=Klugiella xanthotipulae TaxID=244735 RepID=A0A543I5T7_9MICO|nr:FtsX-like permease family protein [Klugiella xanthotipulae]TQM65934.1 FtsX-like permease family protein [Klugiella xanthotipulae]